MLLKALPVELSLRLAKADDRISVVSNPLSGSFPEKSRQIPLEGLLCLLDYRRNFERQRLLSFAWLPFAKARIGIGSESRHSAPPKLKSLRILYPANSVWQPNQARLASMA